MPNPIHPRITLTTIALCACSAFPAFAQPINEAHKLLPGGGRAQDRFGENIAIQNGIVALGAPNAIANSGLAYLFNASTGQQLFTLQTTNGSPEDKFGSSIAIDNGIAAVGALWDNNNGTKSGAAYLFDTSNGQQIVKLIANDGTYNDHLGSSIAIDNDIVAVGAFFDDENGERSGSAYLFDAKTGAQITKLLPNDGTAFDQFGSSIDIDNGIVAVSAHYSSQGSAYLFDASTGAQLFKLTPNDGEADDQFGHDIAIENGIVAVGAPRDDDNNTDSGSVYLFNAHTGQQIAKLLPNDGGEQDRFGRSVAIENGIAAIGAWGMYDENGAHSGAAYLFNVSTNEQIAKLLSSDGEEFDHLGISIDIDNGIVAIGADGDDVNGEGSGSAYLFSTPNFCPADLNNDNTFNFFDIHTFIESLGDNTSLADFNNDSSWDYFDVSLFMKSISAGCP